MGRSVHSGGGHGCGRAHRGWRAPCEWAFLAA